MVVLDSGAVDTILFVTVRKVQKARSGTAATSSCIADQSRLFLYIFWTKNGRDGGW